MIYWKEEDALSVVKAADVVDGSLCVGERCTVRIKKEVYPGQIAGVGEGNFELR